MHWGPISWVCILCSLPFVPFVCKEALFIALDVSHQIQFQLDFGFPNCVCMLGLRLYTSQVKPPELFVPVFTFFMLPFNVFNLVNSRMFIHADLLVIFEHFPAC